MPGVQRKSALNRSGRPVRSANTLAAGDQQGASSQTACKPGTACPCDVTRAA